jgi:hypothetical protein
VSVLVNAPCRVAVRPDAVGAKDQRSVRRAGTYVHSPPPVAALHVAPDAPAPRYSSTATPSSAAARGEYVSSNAPTVVDLGQIECGEKLRDRPP